MVKRNDQRALERARAQAAAQAIIAQGRRLQPEQAAAPALEEGAPGGSCFPAALSLWKRRADTGVPGTDPGDPGVPKPAFGGSAGGRQLSHRRYAERPGPGLKTG